MFEKFTKDAREVVVAAVHEAEETHASEVDPLHVLTALTRFPHGAGAGVLAGYGIALDDVQAGAERIRRRGGLSDADAEALEGLGIDVHQVVERIEQEHGRGVLAQGPWPRPDKKRRHLPFTGSAKRVLERCLREAVDLGDKHIGGEHILLGLAVLPGPASDVLASLDIEAEPLRRELRQRR